VEMSAFVPGPPVGAGGTNDHAPGSQDALTAARQEAANLRQVLEAVQEALGAANLRIEALEEQLGIVTAAPNEPAEPTKTLRPARSVAEWKLAGWTPAAGAEAVTAETLRARREALGISQAAVAHAAHCSRGLVAEVERGKRRSAQTLSHLSSVIGRLEQQARRN
jgi:DNA-binding transcriptional regulator YiaG